MDTQKAVTSHLATLYGLVEAADVFIENYRPGVTKRLGVSYDDLRQYNPRLVYCSITGYGQTGPYAKKGAFDVTVQAMSGLMSVTGEEDGSPVKCGIPVADFAAGLYGAYTTLAAIHRAQRTGEGCHIDCSMLGSLLGLAALQTSEYFGNRTPPRRLGSAHPRNAPYQAYNAKDRPFTVAAGNNKLWRDFCGVVGMSHLLTDSRFQTQLDRAANQKAMTELVQPVFLTKDAAEWLLALDAMGIPCAPILNYAEVLSNEHVRHMGLVKSMTLSNGMETDTVGFPIAISGHKFEIRRAPPALGEHNVEVLADWLGNQRQK
jgi:succinate---hydroxymethylglutarate CoA-transferase